MRLIDSHCHLQASAFDEDRAEILAQSLDVLDGLVVIGDNSASNEAAAAMTGDRVRAAVGIHPHNAKDWADDSESHLESLLARPGVTALGEIGLDYYYDFSPRESQIPAFEAQLLLAARRNMPVVIHSREAEADTLAILRNAAPALNRKGIMHCFPGGAEFAVECMALGFHISYAGNATFPKADKIREAVAVTPLDRLLVETDSPYLAPKPMRGRRCIPAYVEHTARFIAELKGVSFEEVVMATSANACAIFGLGLPENKRT